MIINEVDSAQPGGDTMEFIELYDGGAGNTSLAGLVVVLYDGASDTSYAAFDLDAYSTNANGYFTLGNALVPGVDLVFADGLLMNGADAVALYQADAVNFPNGTPVTTTNLRDALVYDTNASGDDPELQVLLNPGQPQIDELSGPNANSMQRCPNGSGGGRNTSTYVVLRPNPDGVNPCTVMVSGRVFTTGGLALRNAVVMLIDSQGFRRTATTSSFGLYSFDNVFPFQTYTITVSSKRYRFTPRVMTINDNVANLDFVGLE